MSSALRRICPTGARACPNNAAFRFLPSSSPSTFSYPTFRRLLSTPSSYDYRSPEIEVDHLVVGGGVIGLAIAAELTTQLPTKTTYLVERHAQIGQEISSRNSEVIHGGLYYPLASLKSKYCIRGREMIYERCERLKIPYKKCQKLVVATTKDQIQYLDQLHSYLQHPAVTSPGVPTYFLGGDEARDMEPDLGKNVLCAMLSTESGVVDSHALMTSLELEIINGPERLEKGEAGQVKDAGDSSGHGEGNGSVVLGTKVVRIDPYRDEQGGRQTGSSKSGWVVQILTEGSDQPDSIFTKCLVLSAGLSSVHLLNPLLPERERLKAYYAKGSYMSYKGPGVSNVQRLLYPCPQEGLAGLGTHLTIDLAGNIKFGPDVEYITPPPGDASEIDPDFWRDQLQPSPHRLEEMASAVRDYLPGIDPAGLTPDYAGIRPKLNGPGTPFADFHFSYDPVARPGLVALCGFESPGLTSSLAIGQDVREMIQRDVWGEPPSE